MFWKSNQNPHTWSLSSIGTDNRQPKYGISEISATDTDKVLSVPRTDRIGKQKNCRSCRFIGPTGFEVVGGAFLNIIYYPKAGWIGQLPHHLVHRRCWLVYHIFVSRSHPVAVYLIPAPHLPQLSWSTASPPSPRPELFHVKSCWTMIGIWWANDFILFIHNITISYPPFIISYIKFLFCGMAKNQSAFLISRLPRFIFKSEGVKHQHTHRG